MRTGNLLASMGFVLATALSGHAAAQPVGQVFTFREACDGSAAVALDREHFAVADDDSNVLRIYRVGHASPLPSSIDLNVFLKAREKKNKPGVFKEADIEGAARIGDRIYWIGSHGRDSNGEDEPERARFFSTRIVANKDGPRLDPVGTDPYVKLRDDMLADPDLKLAKLKLAEAYAPGKKKGPAPESDTGFNIEALAATPDGQLLVGFRNPRPENLALIVPIKNPGEVVDKGSKPVFGRPIRLDLGGRGIRSMEWIGDRYVIVAGPHGPAGKSNTKPPFFVRTWSGKESDTKLTPVHIELPPDFTPEAIFVSPDGSTLTLLSDDGDLKGCKDADRTQKTFRALTIPTPK